jgi:hypothetical protein
MNGQSGETGNIYQSGYQEWTIQRNGMHWTQDAERRQTKHKTGKQKDEHRTG